MSSKKEKKITFNDESYLILLHYFKGDVIYLNETDVKNLKKGKYKDEEVPVISKDVSKLFLSILKTKKEKPKQYASIKWNYPDWDDLTKQQKLKETFPDKYPDLQEESKDKSDGESEGYTPLSPVVTKDDESEGYTPLSPGVTKKDQVDKLIIPQRKAFIEWMNEEFYQKQKENKPSEDETKIYQYLVKQYLSYETPYRGLLVYHGLGTGKTATAVVTSEGLSKDMNIYTLLPASLEREFIKEIKRWGDNLFKINKNNWVYISIDKLTNDVSLRKKIKELYGIDVDIIKKIFNKTKLNIRNILKKLEEKDIQNYYQLSKKEVVDYYDDKNIPNGIFLQANLDDEKEIYSITGKPILSKNKTYNGKCNKLTKYQVKFIEEEINFLIQLKYNFIHYNPFPKVDKSDFKELIYNKKTDTEIIKDETSKTNNQKIVDSLTEKYKYNVENFHIYSPFYNDVIIIDEVHNFIREIINESGPANVFYNWIVNADNVKLIFLSGTPVINKPCEIAVLYNMLRGVLNIFEFSVIIDEEINEEDIQNELQSKLYEKNKTSTIEQLLVSKKSGKLIISFTKNKTNFESILEDNIIKVIKHNQHTYDDFFNEIYNLLHDIFKPEYISPKQSEFKKLSEKDLKNIYLGKPKIFDEEINLIFNRKQKLFDIYENNQVFDLTDNNVFMEFLFDDSLQIPSMKKVLLRRMLMGMTSYKPIDRTSIVNMPEINESYILPRYSDYKIIKDVNVIPCYMSSVQWSKYSEEYNKEKMRNIQRLRRKALYDDGNFDYHIRTRQNCNIVYEDDSFRKIKEDDKEKHKVYEKMRNDNHFLKDGSLKLYSPKYYEIMKNLYKYVNDDNIPTGKVLFYSDFRKDAGAESFEQTLQANGYEKYNHNINDLVASKNKKKRYTFFTGEEKQDERILNKEAYNHNENIYGEYIQIIIISSAGAEGLSLKGVRQVHIMEPYWNFIRIGQVFGRAIRIESHSDLPESERNVDQYLYLSFIPDGEDVDEVFHSLKQLQWSEVDDINITENIKDTLFSNHKGVYKTIQQILQVKKETDDRTADQVLFDIMEKKHKVSLSITDIIKESAIDCIQHTKDDIQLNEKCIRFPDDVKQEDTHFPGITSNTLNQMDKKQFQLNFIYNVEDNIYVISGKENNIPIFIYYEINDDHKEMDVRYIRENGKRMCDYKPHLRKFIIYEPNDNPINKHLGSKFSVFQSIYEVSDDIIEGSISQGIFPPLNEIIIDENFNGLIIKYNIHETLFYSPKQKLEHLFKLYHYDEYISNGYSTESMKMIILRKKKSYISN
jgi:hypothetical protein